MKICTITCHDVYNHGASLQAYALMKYLDNKGHTVKIIDYKPDYLSSHYSLTAINNPKWGKNLLIKTIYLLLKLPGRIIALKRKREFDRFTAEFLELTPKRYSSNQQLKNSPPIADVYICGSDQIWNSLHKNGRDPAFYLDFVPENRKKVSYAASFATETILDEYKNFVTEKVNNLDWVSVREKSGVAILNDLGINHAVNVLDPVFLLSKDDWNQIAKHKYTEKYILVYDFDNNNLIKKLALEIAEKTGMRIYSINPFKNNYADKSFKYVGPQSFISLIRDATFILSNSFHAAVFSVIYNKNFLIVNRKENINTRMRDLLDDLNLKERLISESYDFESILKPINYNEVEKILKDYIDSSTRYINIALISNNQMVGNA